MVHDSIYERTIEWYSSCGASEIYSHLGFKHDIHACPIKYSFPTKKIISKSLSSGIPCKCYWWSLMSASFWTTASMVRCVALSDRASWRDAAIIQGDTSQAWEGNLAFWMFVFQGKNIFFLWIAGRNKHQNKGLGSVILKGLVTSVQFWHGHATASLPLDAQRLTPKCPLPLLQVPAVHLNMR